jgi:SSS family transporter
MASLDLVVFAGYMLLLVGVGVYFSYQRKGLQSYLLADQNVHWIVMAVSVLAALFSGITYLAAPAEAFFFDLSYLWVMAATVIATPITALLFLPFFRTLNVYTAYEYLEKRFDRRLRRVGSALFIARISGYLGLVISAPALVIVEVTGWDFVTSVLLTGVAATLYTSLGGMKAVIWTDSLQFLVLCGGIVLLLGFAVAAVPGGLPVIWEWAAAHGKTRLVHLDFDPTVRLTVWAGLLGGAANQLVQMVTDQIAVQRYLTTATLREAQRGLWLKMGLAIPLTSLFFLTGTVLYGYYGALPERTPAFANAAQVPGLAPPAGPLMGPGLKNDSLLPYFVVHDLPSPLPGLLLAAVFGATMAVVSAGINALATALLMDFLTPADASKAPETRQLRRARVLTVGFGVLATVLALLVGKMGTLIEASAKIFGLFGGPLLGIFFLGILSRRANGSGSLLGAVGGAIVGGLVAFSEELFAYPISFLWVTFAATLVTFVFGWVASWLFAVPGPHIEKLVYRRSFF